MIIKNGFVLFYGIKDIYSQWHPCSFVDEYNQEYSSTEQYMMVHKAKTFQDFNIMDKMLKTKNPRDIKQLGREVKNFDENIWKIKSAEVVFNGNYLKFSQNDDFRKQLLDTNHLVIVEASKYDTIWGIGLDENHIDATNPEKWIGENKLGLALMNVRAALR